MFPIIIHHFQKSIFSDTGWAKSAWSNVFAPWSQAAGVFVHDMPKFETLKVLEVLKTEPITTLCAPPTLYRSLIQCENLTEFESLRLVKNS